MTAKLLRKVRKIWRFVKLYGFRRTVYKVAGRVRPDYPIPRFRNVGQYRVGVIGCGQFAYATIAYFLRWSAREGIKVCYDIERKNAESFATFHDVAIVAETPSLLFEDDSVSIIYIASNHATHASYAREALRSGKDVYIEKPVAVSLDQLKQLCKAQRASGRSVYAGYNRPFSPAIQLLKKYCTDLESPLTLSCFVSGHVIDRDHWYRRPEEGTRICGNVGHWLDLLVHILCWGEIADKWSVHVISADPNIRDDNLSVCLTSSRGDLANIVLTSRAEPFEGINETINIQWGDCIATIDDFRSIRIWKDDVFRTKKFWRKDVGHKQAICQPFLRDDSFRDWREVEISSLLMLTAKEMIETGASQADFSVCTSRQELTNLDRESG